MMYAGYSLMTEDAFNAMWEEEEDDDDDEPTMYEVLDSDLNLVLEEAETEAAAIAFVIAELSTDVFPAVIREDNGEITAIIWCGVVYRPEEDASNA